jgi:hypothetical protein
MDVFEVVADLTGSNGAAAAVPVIATTTDPPHAIFASRESLRMSRSSSLSHFGTPRLPPLQLRRQHADRAASNRHLWSLRRWTCPHPLYRPTLLSLVNSACNLHRPSCTLGLPSLMPLRRRGPTLPARVGVNEDPCAVGCTSYSR